jgi:hypothetical protein
MHLRAIGFMCALVLSGQAMAGHEMNVEDAAELQPAIKNFQAVADQHVKLPDAQAVINSYIAFGFVAGVADTLRAGKMICLPETSSQIEMMGVAGKYLDGHQDQWKYGAVALVGTALEKAYPCKTA